MLTMDSQPETNFVDILTGTKTFRGHVQSESMLNYKPILLIFANGSLKQLLSEAGCPIHWLLKIHIVYSCLCHWVTILHRSCLRLTFWLEISCLAQTAVINWTEIDLNQQKSPFTYKLEMSAWFTVHCFGNTVCFKCQPFIHCWSR